MDVFPLPEALKPDTWDWAFTPDHPLSGPTMLRRKSHLDDWQRVATRDNNAIPQAFFGDQWVGLARLAKACIFGLDKIPGQGRLRDKRARWDADNFLPPNMLTPLTPEQLEWLRGLSVSELAALLSRS